MIYLMLGDKEEHFYELEHTPMKMFRSIEALQAGIQQSNLFETFETAYCENVDLKLVDMKILKESKKDVILLMETIDKRSALYKACNKKVDGKSRVFHSDGTGWKAVVQEYGLEKYDFVMKYFQDNPTYMGPARQLCLQIFSLDKVTEDSVKLVVGTKIEDEIFLALDFLLTGNTNFFKLYADLLYLKESEFKMMVLLHNRISDIVKLYSYRNEDINTITSKTGLNYYSVKNNVAIAKLHSLNTILKWFNLTLDLEMGIRSGRDDHKIAWENLITNIMEEAK